MTIGIGAVGGCRGLFVQGAGADIEASIFEETGGSGESIFEGIKSDRVERTSGLIKTPRRERGKGSGSVRPLEKILKLTGVAYLINTPAPVHAKQTGGGSSMHVHMHAATGYDILAARVAAGICRVSHTYA